MELVDQPDDTVSNDIHLSSAMSAILDSARYSPIDGFHLPMMDSAKDCLLAKAVGKSTAGDWMGAEAARCADAT